MIDLLGQKHNKKQNLFELWTRNPFTMAMNNPGRVINTLYWNIEDRLFIHGNCRPLQVSGLMALLMLSRDCLIESLYVFQTAHW